MESELRVESLRFERQEFVNRSEILEAEEMAMLARSRPLATEAEALTEHYDQQKRFLFAYSAALSRGIPRRDSVLSDSLPSGSTGITALIQALAKQCGSPEVAFLML